MTTFAAVSPPAAGPDAAVRKAPPSPVRAAIRRSGRESTGSPMLTAMVPFPGGQKSGAKVGKGWERGLGVVGAGHAHRHDLGLGLADQQMDAPAETDACRRRLCAPPSGNTSTARCCRELADDGADAFLADAVLIDRHRVETANEPGKITGCERASCGPGRSCAGDGGCRSSTDRRSSGGWRSPAPAPFPACYGTLRRAC